MSNKATEPYLHTITQNTWGKVLDRNNSRKSLHVWATEAADRDLLLPDGDNPWAMSFTTDAIITLPAGLVTALEAITKGIFKFRFKIDSDAGAHALFSSSDNSTSDYFYIYVHTDDKVRAKCVIGSVTQWELEIDTALVVGDWYVLKFVHDGVSPKFYLNGGVVPQTFLTSTDKTAFLKAIDTSSDLTNAFIGKTEFGSSANYLEGDIDWIKIWDSTNGAARPLATYSFDEGTGTTIADKVNSYDGTSSGTESWVIRGNAIPMDLATDKEVFFRDSHGPFVHRAVWAYSTAVSTPILVLETENTDDR